MVAAVGSSPISAMPSGGFGTAGLEAQIARYEKQLSDCVNCSSAKTPEGKKAIEEISNKISATRARIDQVLSAKEVAQPAAAVASSENKSPVLRDGNEAAVSGESGTVALPKSAYSTLGSVVNVFG